MPTVVILRRVWLQNYWWDGTQLRWREVGNISPAAQFISSPYDVDAHYARKYTTQEVGYKIHLTETCEDDAPHLITHVEIMSSPTADGVVTPRSTRRRSIGAYCPASISWTLASWTPTCSSGVRSATAWISWGPRALTITGKLTKGPALTPSTSRLLGTGNTPSVRWARLARAGRRLSIIVGIR
jgi:hypothetical protein